MTDIHAAAEQIARALSERYPNTPITIAYHPDADPGDGTGWCVEVEDEYRWYGTLGEALEGALSGRRRA